MKLSLILMTIVFILFMVASVAAYPRQTLEKNLPADPNIKEIHLDADLGVADLLVRAHDGGNLFDADVRYDEDAVKVGIDIEKSGSGADISLSSNHIDDFDDFDSEDNRWKLSLSRDCTWNITFDIGVCETEMDLTGLAIDRLALDIGASECDLTFTEPSPQPIRRISIDAGAGEMDFKGLGYTNFENFDFDGGAGEFTVDFAGLKDGYHYAHIDGGVGEIAIHLPEDFPVRIDVDDSWLSSVEIYGADIEEIEDNVYESENFSKDRGLELEIEIGIGEVTISKGDKTRKVKTKHRKRYGDDDMGYIFDGENIIRWSNGDNVVFSLPEIPEIPHAAAMPSLNIVIPKVELPEMPAIAPMVELPELDFAPLLELPEIPPVPAIPEGEDGTVIFHRKIPE